MTEPSNDYPTELFDGALTDLKRLDASWRAEARAVKARYAAALVRRDQALADMVAIKDTSAERSRVSQDLRQELARSAFDLISGNDNLRIRRNDTIQLAVQYETGLWLDTKETRSLMSTVDALDEAVKNDEIILHFQNGEFDYVLKPAVDSLQTVVELGERPTGMDISIPHAAIVTRTDHSWKNGTFTPSGGITLQGPGEKSIIGDLIQTEKERRYGEDDKHLVTFKKATLTRKVYSPTESDHAFVIGHDGIERTIRALIESSQHGADESLPTRAFLLWQGVSSVSNRFSAFEGDFINETVSTLSDFVYDAFSGHTWNKTPFECIKPLVTAARRQGLGPQITKEVTRRLEAGGYGSLMRNRQVVETAYEYLVAGTALEQEK